MKVPAREQLVVIYEGEEWPGIIIYGLGAPGSIQREAQEGLWEPGQTVHKFILHGEHWEVLLWELPLTYWPSGDMWQSRLRDTLIAMIANGAVVAWVGAEGILFSDPPYLFDPEHMSGGVLAWRTADGRTGGSLDPDQPLSPISDAEMLALRQYAHGL